MSKINSEYAANIRKNAIPAVSKKYGKVLVSERKGSTKVRIHDEYGNYLTTDRMGLHDWKVPPPRRDLGF